MNLFSLRRKARDESPARFSFVSLPVLKSPAENGSPHSQPLTQSERGEYIVPRVRESATSQVLHIDNASHRYPRVLLSGLSGAGKSSALQFIVETTARAEAAVVSLADHHINALPTNFENAAWILLDDVSLPEHIEHLATLARQFPTARIWAATRDPNLVAEGFTPLALLPFNEREIISFAESWFPLPPVKGHAVRRANRAAEAFVASLKADAGTRELAANPLSLFMLVQVYHPAEASAPAPVSAPTARVIQMAGGQSSATPFDVPVRVNIAALPTRRAQLFDEYIKAALTAESDPDFAARALEGIALSIKRGQRAKSEHLARGYGLLEERPSGRVEFKHSLLGDFLAARALRRNPDLAPLREHLFDPEWRDVVLFYAGLGDVGEVVKEILETGDYYFAAYVLSASDQAASELSEQVVKPLVQRAWDDHDERAMDALGAWRSNMATDFFAAKLRERNAELRKHAAYVLGRLHTDRALEYLLPQLRDNNPDVRDQVVASLGQSRSDRVIEPLLVALRGDPRVGTVDTRMRIAAARALGEVGTDKAVPALIVDLQVGEPEVREQAIVALNKIRSEFAIKPLESLVATHPKPEVQDAAKQVLNATEGK